MKYTRVYLNQLEYQLGPVVVSSDELEARLMPVYEALRIQPGQLQSFTGIRERRWWQPDAKLADGAISAAQRALTLAGINASDLGAVIYTGVCREQFEPATACRVAAALGVNGDATVLDISNACLGTLNGILDVANRIELGQIRAGLVISAESSREINEAMLAQLLQQPSQALFNTTLATFTGGSGAIALLLSDGSHGGIGHKLVGGITLTAPQHYQLCTWGLQKNATGQAVEFMSTDAVATFEQGMALGVQTWQAFLEELQWQAAGIDKVICHQVSAGHRDGILKALNIPTHKDFSTFAYLGNMGTVSLPITAALASQRGFLNHGERVVFLGIGSGLSCTALGWEWQSC